MIHRRDRVGRDESDVVANEAGPTGQEALARRRLAHDIEHLVAAASFAHTVVRASSHAAHLFAIHLDAHRSVTQITEQIVFEASAAGVPVVVDGRGRDKFTGSRPTLS
jgi:hypothetical protein